MGIKYFFSWLKKTFPSHIQTFTVNNNILEHVHTDNFLVDMNGIFHYCCQKIYQYGLFKNNHIAIRKTNSLQKQNQLFEMVGQYIDRLIKLVKPKKRVVLAIDGPAPISKQNQQRQRRYRSAKEKDDGAFDSNCITPGTKFLDHLGKYIDWFIRKQMSQQEWGDIEVIYSSEKVPGEGEHKLVKFVREHGDEKESYMIQGMDADLIMLSLATHYPNFHILRENPYRYEHEYYYIDMSSIRQHLVNSLLCDQSLLADRIHINDFILMIFLTGNDFLPHLPTIEILEGGVDNLFETYRIVTKTHSSLTNSVDTLNIKSLQSFLGTLGSFEKQFLEEKRSKSIAFPDTLLEKHTKLKEGNFVLDFDTYRSEYYRTKMNIESEDDIKKACIKYVQGLQWVLTYYTHGTNNWKWYYPYYYAPFLSDIANYMEDYDQDRTVCQNPYHPFMQLLCVLPKESKHLLPDPLQGIMNEPEFYPDEFKVDMDGKHNSWEGVVILPPMNFNILEKEYKKLIGSIDERDKKRNFFGKNFRYRYTNVPYNYNSFYGDLKECRTLSEIF